MARAVYSKQFFSQAGVSGRSTSVIVPAGHVYYVRQATIYLDPTAIITNAILEDETSGAALFAGAHGPGESAWFGFYGMLVFEEGGGFHWQVNGESADCSCSGYDLTPA